MASPLVFEEQKAEFTFFCRKVKGVIASFQSADGQCLVICEKLSQ